MIIIGTILGIILIVAGGSGLALTLINYAAATTEWINGFLIYGVFILLGLAVIAAVVATPKER